MKDTSRNGFTTTSEEQSERSRSFVVRAQSQQIPSFVRTEHAQKKGFTIVELLVVVSIIAILSTIVMVNISSAREKARDAQRNAEIEQIALTLETFRHTHGHFPCEVADADCPGQTVDANFGTTGVIGEAIYGGEYSGITTLLSEFLSSVPHDPLGPGDSQYKYYYDGNQWCGGQAKNQAVLAVIKMEDEEKGNADDTICDSWGGEGGIGGAGSYMIVLGPTSDYE